MAEIVICLDTSVLIDYFRKKNKEQSYFYHLLNQYTRFTITSVTEFEIRCGIKKEQEEIWKDLLTEIEVLPFDSLASQLAADIDQALKRKRKQIAIADLFIAATAIRHNTSLATLNKKHFSRIDKLIIIE